MKHLLTFSSAKYHGTTKRIVEDAPRLGADAVHVVDECWLRDCRPLHWERTQYFRELPGVRGVNWFCFKPYVVGDFFRRLPAGDVLLYVDADCAPIAPLTPLYDICRGNGGAMLFNALGCMMGHWTKRDAFLLMGCDREEYWNATQAVARFMAFEKGGAFPAEEFLSEWLAHTCNPLINTFDPSVIAPALGLPELPGFRENRCEQSVLGMLAVAYGVQLFRECCDFGEGSDQDRDLYGQVFHQEGSHSYDPAHPKREGSSFRNVFK